LYRERLDDSRNVKDTERESADRSYFLPITSSRVPKPSRSRPGRAVRIAQDLSSSLSLSLSLSFPRWKAEDNRQVGETDRRSSAISRNIDSGEASMSFSPGVLFFTHTHVTYLSERAGRHAVAATTMVRFLSSPLAIAPAECNERRWRGGEPGFIAPWSTRVEDVDLRRVSAAAENTLARARAFPVPGSACSRDGNVYLSSAIFKLPCEGVRERERERARAHASSRLAPRLFHSGLVSSRPVSPHRARSRTQARSSWLASRTNVADRRRSLGRENQTPLRNCCRRYRVSRSISKISLDSYSHLRLTTLDPNGVFFYNNKERVEVSMLRWIFTVAILGCFFSRLICRFLFFLFCVRSPRWLICAFQIFRSRSTFRVLYFRLRYNTYFWLHYEIFNNNVIVSLSGHEYQEYCCILCHPSFSQLYFCQICKLSLNNMLQFIYIFYMNTNYLYEY